ncbi:MAG TPA: BlaI/MecI/CopY family transcriptional regulator [Lachnospiraceae bacterium]|nr:BlaI/MecI/CopY family transcriptional regulator [Lachnospiraceae bacterium]
MEEYTLGNIEGKFADIIWSREPLTTSELIEVCGRELGWKRTTTYTVLKKLSDRGIFENQDGTVIALISKKEFYARQSERYIENSFGGSLPKFLAAFTSRKELSSKEIEELKKIIDSNGR